jgi:hypothetical protein
MIQTAIALVAVLAFLFGSNQKPISSHQPIGVVRPADASLPGPL